MLESAIAFRNPEVYGRVRDVVAGTQGVTVVVGPRR